MYRKPIKYKIALGSRFQSLPSSPRSLDPMLKLPKEAFPDYEGKEKVIEHHFSKTCSRPQTAYLLKSPSASLLIKPATGILKSPYSRPQTSQGAGNRRRIEFMAGSRPMSRAESTDTPQLHGDGINIDDTPKLKHVPSFVFDKATSRYIYIYIT